MLPFPVVRVKLAERASDVNPLILPKWNTILDERKGKADEQEQAHRGADYCRAEASGGGSDGRPKLAGPFSLPDCVSRRGWKSGGVLAGGYLLRGAATSVVHLEGPFKTNRALLGSGAVL